MISENKKNENSNNFTRHYFSRDQITKEESSSFDLIASKTPNKNL